MPIEHPATSSQDQKELLLHGKEEIFYPVLPGEFDV